MTGLKERISGARLEAIFHAWEQGVTDNDTVLREAQIAQEEITDKRGSDTEKRFIRYIKRIPQITSVRRPSREESEGVDWIITHNEKERFIDCKSSDEGVREFIESGRFDPKIIPINVGPKTRFKKFERVLLTKLNGST